MDTTSTESVTAKEAGLKRCASCGRLQKIDDTQRCTKCGAAVQSRRSKSIQRAWAYLVVGMIAYIPANITPIMSTTSFTGNSEDTIMTGIFSLMSSGSYFVAGIVFVASICIPIAKFIIIILLVLTVQLNWNLSEHTQHRLHGLTEFIGRWSMIDVFVVAVLAALIQLGGILTITPGVGINAFAVSVVFTMLAASSLDPRLLWDVQAAATTLDNERVSS